MKTRNLFKSIVVLLALSLIGCNKEEQEEQNNSNTTGQFTTEEFNANAKMDDISNDISEIAEDQLNAQNTARAESYQSILPNCATVTTTVEGNTWTRIIDFGTTGCTYHNGAILKGQIIISGSTDFHQSPYVWTYSFHSFYYDNILVQGTKTLSRTVQATDALATPHPVVGIDLDLDITLPNGNTYSRTGTRTRELIEGYDTPLIFHDNVYRITGNWATTGTNHSYTSTITTPLRVEIACLYKLVSGVITINRNEHTAVLNYGNGHCDNNATISIDGGTPHTFTFRN
ncbi:hypothetical protein FEDK69T_14490 [Flavobacterium enshiense DK69]|uniref:Lipoprotein n=1 Tax=Flavobacterium enshiense DK69 TaxID=1107311 RepID=V6S9F0_9FLAO|nr:hypothetical protein [Flavobacterium enshiense]ESU23293.1 hypothetical protein FEDK69T_14490 [Flavobacterium enshiense DK69]KGO96476.1 hypothetical protein Q767_06115 [Flavobacterium enshiense DK69]